ncbi:MAG: DUF1549 domain-containing protein [Pirellulales bacterium]
MPRHAASTPGQRPLAMALGVAIVLASAARAGEPPLHERIDALIESTAPGPVAPVASDADFLRRAYLDLCGTIPDWSTARAFLDEVNPAKRQALVDRLLAAPRFAWHMQHTFDVMWTERRPDGGIPAAEWQEYLRKSFEDNKPLDQLAREILGADGADPALRPAAKFYLDRGGEPNLLARDVGRLFFGRDLQCAQCHDHPLVDDYLQAEYYGLMAFVNRGTVFNDAQEKKVYYAELAEGEVNYKSVFTGDARDRVLPELPQGTPVSEPMLANEERYVVAPDKDKKVRPLPKYSRRAQLAALATSGTSAAFNRNLANRLWAHMMGRGLAHPLDVQHSGNPAVQSELLALLADELVRMKFDVKAFLRELALSRSYQRSSEEPDAAALKLDPGEVSPKLAAWNAEAARLADELPQLKSASSQADAALDVAYGKFSAAATAREGTEKAGGEAKKASDDVSAALAAAIKDVAAKDDLLQSLVAARVAADAAKAKLPDDKQLAEAAALYQTRAGEVDTALAALRKTVSEKTPEVQTASLKLAETDKALEAATANVAQTRAALEAAEAATRGAVEKLRAAKAQNGELAARIADTERALDYGRLRAAAEAAQAEAQAATEKLASLTAQTGATADAIAAAESAAKTAREKAAAERDLAKAAWTAIVERSTVRFTLGPLKPLSPEQLAWSTMQAVGLVEQQKKAQETEARKNAAAAGDLPPEARAQLEERWLEGLVDKNLGGNVNPFASLFAQQPGQAPTFQATVHQALFLSNGGLLAGWLNPGGGNLTERLAKIEGAGALAEELYLTVLSRPPTADEASQAGKYWEAAKDDRAAAARELVWSLVTSAEFRFNR